MATLELPTTADAPEPESDGLRSNGPGRSKVQPYMWQPPASDRRVILELDVVDRIHQEALRGLGSVPKRGAEVGGVLLGSVTEDGTVCITANVPVNCSHSQGSSYTLNNDEYHKLCETVSRFAPSEGRPAEAVGFYRTHTRDGLGLSLDDVRIFDALFPGDWPVMLLVKPSMTKVSQGAFFFREEGGVQRGSSLLEFPFRRRELSGKDSADSDADEATGHVPAMEPEAKQLTREATRDRARQDLESMDNFESKPERATAAGSGLMGLGGRRPSKSQPMDADARRAGKANPDVDPGSKPKRRWGLIPLSFLFLLLGLFLGIQAALTIGPHLGKPTNPFSLGLRVTPVKNDANKVQLDWNLASAPITGAQDATLYIEDGGVSKTVALTRTQISSMPVVYQTVGNKVHFRLDVRLRDNALYSESIDYTRGK